MRYFDLGSRYAWLPTLTVVLGFAVDRASKIVAEHYLTFAVPVEVIGEYFRLVLWYNEGAAFGLRLGSPWIHIVLSAVALAVVTFVLWHTPRRDGATRFGLALIIAGALGNLWDRVAAGKVTDFLDVGVGTLRWPTFNIADALVVVGIAILIVTHLHMRREPDHEHEDDHSPEPERAAAGSGSE